MTAWGLVALVCGTLAIVSASISSLVPDDVLASLHASRLGGASLHEVRAQLADVRAQTEQLRADNTRLVNRFNLLQKADGLVTRRVGALEVSIPRLLEALPQNADVDTGIITGSIGNKPAPVHFVADGGSVSVTHLPFDPTGGANAGNMNQPLPPMPAEPAPSPTPNPKAFGIALGAPISAEIASSAWQGLNVKLGPLLLGLGPLVGPTPDGAGAQIVAGPIADKTQAKALCQPVEKVGISCAPVPFTGAPLAN